MVKVLTSLLALVSFQNYFNWFGVKFGMISNMELTERTLSEDRLYSIVIIPASHPKRTVPYF